MSLIINVYSLPSCCLWEKLESRAIRLTDTYAYTQYGVLHSFFCLFPA